MNETTVSDRPRDDDERMRDTSRQTSDEESEFLQIEVRELELPLSFSIGKLKVLAHGKWSLYALLVLLVVLGAVAAVLWTDGIIP